MFIRTIRNAVIEVTANEALPPSAGGKALGLCSILAAGLDVPRAWVVLPGASDDAIRGLGSMLQREGLAPLAVRSSGDDEDGTSSSFAGIHESLLGVAPDDLLEAVRTVAASPLAERAAAYRREMGLAPARGPCAVVVQALVAAQRSGVAFGVGQENRGVMVEAVEGLGERLVQGQETPEAWELERGDGSWQVRRSRTRRQNRALLAGDWRCRTEDRLGAAATADILTEAEAVRVAEGVVTLQAAAHVPLDVEWCIDAGGALFFVQSRPRTRPLGALYPGQIWSRSNYREVLPELTPALTRSYVLAAMRRGMRRYMAPYASLVKSEAPVVECIHGRLVSNESVVLELMDGLGIPRSLLDVTLGGGEGGQDRFEPMQLRDQARHPIMMTKAVWRALSAGRAARRLIAQARRLRDEAQALSLRELPDADLLPYLGPVVVEFGERFAFVSLLVIAALQNAQYGLASALRSEPHPGALITRLVAPELRTVSTRLTDELVELASAFRHWEGGAAVLDEMTEAHAGPAPWQEQLPPDLFGKLQAWIERYGHRGAFESDLSSTRYGDDWRLVAEQLRPLVVSEGAPESPDERCARLRWESEKTWNGLCARLGPLKRRAIRHGLKVLSQLLAQREQLRSEAIACLHGIRPVFFEAGRRLAQRGRLAACEDVWHLQVDELARAPCDADFDCAGAVAREKGRLAAWRRIEVPNRFRSEDLATFPDRSRQAVASATRLQGTGISPGLVEGRARLLETPHEGSALRAGEILVAHVTDPGWTPLFARAGGVLVEMGGTLSHAGIVAREFGIPCVANVENVMQVIRDGQLLRIDGTTGDVRVVEESDGDAT